jgi:hypothetical protein
MSCSCLYESKARCWRRHSGSNFTDEGFHNTGVNWGDDPADLGRFAVTKKGRRQGQVQDADTARRGADRTVHARWQDQIA